MKPNSDPSIIGELGPRERRNVCNCFGITYAQMQQILKETNGADMATLKKFYQVGTRCTSCEYEIKDLITEYREEQRQGEISFVGLGVPLSRKISTAFRRLRHEIAKRLIPRRYAIFVIRRQDMESSLVLSNMQFPEDHRNANGSTINFRVILFDETGQGVFRSPIFRLKNNASREFWLSELFPSIKGDITGMIFIDYGVLTEAGSLRPYCCLNFRRVNEEFQGRWHYHDKYRSTDYNGHYHCNHPFVAGQVCYIAASNPTDRPYQSKIFLRTTDGRISETVIRLPPYGSFWHSLPNLFPETANRHSESNALLWLEYNQALMVWFFWHKQADNIWLVQHH